MQRTDLGHLVVNLVSKLFYKLNLSFWYPSGGFLGGKCDFRVVSTRCRGSAPTSLASRGIHPGEVVAFCAADEFARRHAVGALE
jgi:hypothetical protein